VTKPNSSAHDEPWAESQEQNGSKRPAMGVKLTG